MNKLNHVAFIMDGNGRWGKKKKKNRNSGHYAGVKTVKKIVEASIKLKIPAVTFYVFSTENWKRPKNEIKFLFNLLENFLDKKIKDFNENNIKFKILGNINTLNPILKKKLYKSQEITQKNNKLQVNLALNYGSKYELVDTFKILNKKKKKISIKNIENSLYTAQIPDPDILIRTGDTKRLSNFMLWQLAYSEIYFEKKLWPDFNEKDFLKIINQFKKTKRNYGNI